MALKIKLSQDNKLIYDFSQNQYLSLWDASLL